MVLHLQPFDFACVEVFDHDLERVQHHQRARRAAVQLLADTVFQHAHIDHGLLLGHTHAFTEVANGGRRVTAAAHTLQGRQTRIVPAADVAVAHQAEQLAFAGDGVVELKAREFNLLRMRRHVQLIEYPVVERAVVFEFKRAQRVGDAFQRITDAVRVVIHRVDFPRLASTVMGGVADAEQRRVAQIDVGRGHVDARAQDVGALGELAAAHARE